MLKGITNLIMVWVLIDREVVMLEIEQGKNKSKVTVFWKDGNVHMFADTTSFIGGQYGIVDACDKLKEWNILTFHCKPTEEPNTPDISTDPEEIAEIRLHVLRFLSGGVASIKDTMLVMQKQATEAVNSLKEHNYKDTDGNYTAWLYELVSAESIAQTKGGDKEKRALLRLFGIEQYTMWAQGVGERLYNTLVKTWEQEVNLRSTLDGRFFIDKNDATGGIGVYYREEVVG